jgi:hypothetical protein
MEGVATLGEMRSLASVQRARGKSGELELAEAASERSLSALDWPRKAAWFGDGR